MLRFICFRSDAVKEGGWTSDIFQNVTLPGKGGGDIQPSFTPCKHLDISEKAK